jgi:D-methionine transport system substrate-binding protein
MIKKLFLLFTFSLFACTNNKDSITVGTISGPETALMEVAQKVAHKKYGLTINIKTFSDYVIPNIALNDGSIDANVYQHLPYLEAAIKNRGFDLVAIGKTFIYPMGVYSKKLTNLSLIKNSAIVALPNDPSNEARALLLLQKAGLITLTKIYDATVLDIKTNPKKLQFKTMSAAQLPRVLNDVDIAVINTNFAVASDLSPQKDSLFLENKDSPYANIIVVRRADKDNPKLKLLVKALNSKQVLDKATKLFKSQALPAWRYTRDPS